MKNINKTMSNYSDCKYEVLYAATDFTYFDGCWQMTCLRAGFTASLSLSDRLLGYDFGVTLDKWKGF